MKKLREKLYKEFNDMLDKHPRLGMALIMFNASAIMALLLFLLVTFGDQPVQPRNGMEPPGFGLPFPW